jgi:hypothetical protein
MPYLARKLRVKVSALVVHQTDGIIEAQLELFKFNVIPSKKLLVAFYLSHDKLLATTDVDAFLLGCDDATAL